MIFALAVLRALVCADSNRAAPLPILGSASTTSTTVHTDCLSYPTGITSKGGNALRITETRQYVFCKSRPSCQRCHLVFSDPSQAVYGAFLDLADLCPRLETLSVHNNVFLNGPLSNLARCTGIQRLVFAPLARLPHPVHIMDLFYFKQLKIFKAVGVHGDIRAFETGFPLLSYVDVSNGYLIGAPSPSFWDNVFDYALDFIDTQSLGASFDQSLNTSTFAESNFLTVSNGDFGLQFLAVDA